MITRYKYKSDVPYSLHDMRIERIEMMDQSLKLFFEQGYSQSCEPYKQVDGTIVFEEADLDFCFVYLLSKNGELGKFNGEKFTLPDFLKCYEDFSFEVTDENYGYNSVVYSGYLIFPENNNVVEATIAMYYAGDIIYETEE